MSTVLKHVCASGNLCEFGNLVKHIFPAGWLSVLCNPIAGKPGEPVTNLKNKRRFFFFSKYFKYFTTCSNVFERFQSPWSKSILDIILSALIVDVPQIKVLKSVSLKRLKKVFKYGYA